jgi:hypothetical protein
MANYFNYFPKTLYSLEDKGTKLDTITNIVARFAFEDKLKENSATFYKYQIKDSDTPEIIASKYYGSPEKHWIVLLFNNIIDPQWDWPVNDRILNEYIDKKYSTSEYANTANTSVSGLTFSKLTFSQGYEYNVNMSPEEEILEEKKVYGFYKVVTTTTSEKTTVEKFKVDMRTYYTNNEIMQNGTNENYQLDDGTTVNITITKETQTYFDYESEINENKRTIKLLKSEFVPAVEKEFRRIIRQ